MAFKGLFKNFENTIDEAINDPNKADDLINGKGGGIIGKLTRATLTDEDKAEMTDGINMARNAQTAQNSQNSAVVATGRVLNVVDTRSLVMGYPAFNLTLEVNRPGLAPFQYEVQAVVDRSQIPQIGNVVNLIDDPNNQGQYLFAGVQFNG